ncbi:CHAT domain-containing protein [Sorangium sp. So ce429]
MPRQEERLTLTIDLARKGRDLVRTYVVPAQGEVATHASPFDAIGDSYRAGDARGLAALHGVLARGDRAELDASLTGGQLDRAGAALFEALFGAEEQWVPVLRAAFRQPEPKPRPDPCRYPLRVRICSSDRDPLLQGLPWRAAMWTGRLLLDEAWTFEVCFDLDPEPAVHFQAPGSILVIAPDLAGMAPIGTAAHLRDLGQVFEGLLPGHAASPRFLVARTPAQIERALRGMQPDIVYFYGHGAVAGGQLTLQLGEGRPEPMLLRDLARLIRERPPRVVFLNGCQTGQAGWHSAGAQLLPDVPVVIANATTAWSEIASRFAVQWFGAWLREGLDPVAALHQLGGRASTEGFAWITPVVHTHYSAFTTLRSSAADRLPYFPPEWLDREEQRSRGFGYISDLARDPRRRVIAALAYAPPGNSLERLPAQVIARVESDAGERLHIRHIALRFPEQRAPRDLAANLAHGLRLQLRHETTAPLQHVLRAHAPRRIGDAVPILWLDWGVFGEPPLRQPELSPEHVTEWLKFVRNEIASICPDEMRVIATVALEMEPSKIPRLGSKLSALEADPDFRNAKFRVRTIPPLKDVELGDILDYLEHVDCPSDLTHELAGLIHRATQGRYEETMSLLKKGPPAWYPLRDELQGGDPEQAAPGSW